LILPGKGRPSPIFGLGLLCGSEKEWKMKKRKKFKKQKGTRLIKLQKMVNGKNISPSSGY